MATCTRRGASIINQLSIQALFKKLRKPILGERTTRAAAARQQACPTPAARHLRRYAAASDSKRQQAPGLCQWSPRPGRGLGLPARHHSQQRACPLPPHTKARQRRQSDLLSCATRLRTSCRAELAHITIWLDLKRFKAAGYVALSRVRRDSDYLLGGRLEPEHLNRAQSLSFDQSKPCGACCVVRSNQKQAATRIFAALDLEPFRFGLG